MARRSGSAGTVRLASGIGYVQNGQRSVFACHNRGNSISVHETSHRGPSIEEAWWWVSWAYMGEGCDRKTPRDALSKPHNQMPWLPKLHWKECVDTLEMQRNRSSFTRPMQTAHSRADPKSARNGTGPILKQFQSTTLQNPQFAGRICVFTYFSSLRWNFHSWCICPA